MWFEPLSETSTCPDCGAPWSGTLSCPECAKRDRAKTNEAARVFVTPDTEPIIGRCPKCQTDIVASYPYSGCRVCGEQLPYSINIKRRPILYGTSHTSESGNRRTNLAPCPDCGNDCSLKATVCPKCGRPLESGDLKVPESHPRPRFVAGPAKEWTPGWLMPQLTPSPGSSESSQHERATRLAASGGILAVISAITFFWGQSYISNWSNLAKAGLYNLAGQTDATYQIAQWCVPLGVIGFIVGLVLFIVGLSQR
jgi:hypothetical protein